MSASHCHLLLIPTHMFETFIHLSNALVCFYFLSYCCIASMMPAFLWTKCCKSQGTYKLANCGYGARFIIKLHATPRCHVTLLFKGPVFTDMDMLITCDPANVHYVQARNFPNFGRGPDLRKMVDDILGDGIIAAESESWENQSQLVKSAMSLAKFKELTVLTAWRKTEAGLIPIMEHAAEKGMEVDLQQLFKCFTFDCACIFVLGDNPSSLCQELPHLPYLEFFTHAEEAILYRNVLPEVVWKMQKWLQIGREKELS